jgi:ADP-ribosylarginine hydrolase
MEDKYISCLLCYGIGDAIGYKNGEWEFLMSDDKIYQFIALGGINHINTTEWRVSDDTILHLCMANSLLSNFKSIGDLGAIFSKELVKARKQFELEGYEFRSVGLITNKNVTKLENGLKWNALPYDNYYGGNGAAMRNICVGLAYHNNFAKLVETSIEMSRITHNSLTGYVGGFISALFASYALNNIAIEEWPNLLMKIYKDKVLRNYIKKTGRDIEEFDKYIDIYFAKWDSYIKDKFDDEGNIIEKRTSINLIWRNKYYSSIATKLSSNAPLVPGAGGDDCMILVYDALLDSKGKWETLVFYSMLHLGDTDTTGAIAASLYGVIFGMSDIPKINYENLELRKELEQTGKKLYKKFYA